MTRATDIKKQHSHSDLGSGRTPAGANPERALLIDDLPEALDAMRQLLEEDGFEVAAYTDPEEACREMTRRKFDFILTDLKMPTIDGIEILRRARDIDESACVILFSGHATVESAVAAINLGAYDYLLKPVDFNELQISLNRARERRRLELSRDKLLETLEESNRQLSRTLEELNALYEASQSLSSTTDIRELLQNILALASGVTKASMGSVMLVNDTGEFLQIAASQGLSAELAQAVQQPIGESISGYVAETGEPLLIDNVELDDRFKRRSAERYGNASLISVPLKIGPRILGVINLSRKSDGSVFSKADLRLLVMFASQAAVAIDDARQFEEKSRQLAEIRALHELSEKMIFVSSQEDMLQLVFETLKKLMPLKYCIWLQHDPVLKKLRAIGAVGREYRLTDSGKIVIDERKLEEPVALNIPPGALAPEDKYELDKIVRHCLGNFGFRTPGPGAFMTAPVRREEAVTYVFCLGAEDAERYSEHQRSLAEIVVSQAAVLYEKEQSLLNSSRLVTMGNMISEISHDLRKPLTTIKGSVGLLRKKIDAEGDTLHLIKMMEDEARRLNELVSELVDFSKPNKYEAEKTDLRALSLRALELVAQDLERRNISTRFSFCESNWEVIVNKNQVFEAILNLLMNAVDAMPGGGELSLTGEVSRPDFKNQDYLALSIRDTGAGIKKSDIPNLFTRYFTTKENGTGLGLAVVERVMSAHNRTVAVDSVEGEGATLTLYFPLASRSA
ncbi:MAG: GAF domain-containing protein [Candidatus Zixiibacteriota bacterium]